MITLNQLPAVKAEMLIRKPSEVVFDSFIYPEITNKFWFTKGSDILEEGKRIRWDWKMYGVWDEILVKRIEKNKNIIVESSDGTTIEWIFTSRGKDETLVTIINSGFKGSGDEVVNQAIDSMGGYTMVLCGLKAFLEHNILLNLIGDKAPDANINNR